MIRLLNDFQPLKENVYSIMINDNLSSNIELRLAYGNPGYIRRVRTAVGYRLLIIQVIAG